jgi:hypothetical protein
MRLLLFVLRLATAGVTTSRGHIELWWRIYHNEVVLACVVIHIFLYIIVCLLDIIELLCLEIVIIYGRVIIIVVFYLDILSRLTWEIRLRWVSARGALLLFSMHLSRHVW